MLEKRKHASLINKLPANLTKQIKDWQFLYSLVKKEQSNDED